MQAKWLFFDMGSTIMDETPAMEKRIRDSIAGTDITYEDFTAKMAEFREMGLREDHAAFAHFGISMAPWPKGTEIPSTPTPVPSSPPSATGATAWASSPTSPWALRRGWRGSACGTFSR